MGLSNVLSDGSLGLPRAMPTAGTTLVEIASGATAQIMPAARAGYLNVLGFVRVKNLSATQPIGYTLQDSDGNVLAANTTVAASTQTFANAGILYTDKAVTATVSGAGGPAQFSGSWSQVLIDDGTRKLVPFVQNVTLAPQGVPSIVPPAGFASLLLGMNAEFGASVGWQLNRDNATATFIWRVTRSAVVWEGNFSTTSGANSRVYSQVFFPTLLPGDTAEFHSLAAPNSPNTLWIGGCAAVVPLVT